MPQYTHITRTNNSTLVPLKTENGTIVETLQHALARLDGTNIWGYSIWKAPAGTNFKAALPYSEEYIQCAGSAEAMTIEVRVQLSPDTTRQFTVGKQEPKASSEPTEQIGWDTGRHHVMVAKNEVFSADEAAKVFAAYYETNEIPDTYTLRELDLTQPAQNENHERPLLFLDAKGNEEAWKPGDPETALNSFWYFLKKGFGPDNPRYIIEDAANNEELILMVDRRMVCRVKHGENPQSEYALTYSLEDYIDRARVFIKQGGYAALDAHGPWYPDEAGHFQALIRDVFSESIIATTHPREIRRRLATLAYINGTSPTKRKGTPAHGDVTHYSYSAPSGGAVNAWFTKTGRGIITVFQPESPFNSIKDGEAQFALYDGVPEYLLAMVRNPLETENITTVSYDGREIVAATGVYVFSGPAEMSDGLVRRMQQEDRELGDTGVYSLLEVFLELRPFSPKTLKKQEVWWSDVAIQEGFEAAEQAEAAQPKPKRDRFYINGFIFYLEQLGYRDATNIYYAFAAGHKEMHTSLMKIMRELQLEVVMPPKDAKAQMIWVRTDPELDAEIASWSSPGADSGTRLLKTLARADLAKAWYHWCDNKFNWAKQAHGAYENDSLLTPNGGFTALPLEAFLEAFKKAGATVSDKSKLLDNGRHRTFSASVHEGDTEVMLDAQLGRGVNSVDCALTVYQNDFKMTVPEFLAGSAFDIVKMRGQAEEHEDAPYPRPIISSHSHLEVFAEQLVAIMQRVAKEWEKRRLEQERST